MECRDITILNGSLHISQPIEGPSVSIDAIFLAASIQANPNEIILDVGSGIGTASLCLAHRLSQVRIHGIELDRKSVRLAADNIQKNNMQHQVEVLCSDLRNPPPRLAPSTFDHVMGNPPYFEEGRGRLSPAKAHAHHGDSELLADWVRFSLMMAKPQGVITLIYPADRMADLLSLLNGKIGCLSIYPLWPKVNQPANRVIIQGIKGKMGAHKLLPGMILHESSGQYTQNAERVLRLGEGIVL